MKHLKTFENFSVNEENILTKFVTGHENKAEKNKAKESFIKALDDAERKVNEDPSKYVFDRASLEKKASENRYLGGLRIQRGGRDTSKLYVVYDKGVTGFQKAAIGAAYAR